MTETNTTETEVVGAFDWLGTLIGDEVYDVLYPRVVSEDWTTMSNEDQVSLAENLKFAYEALGILRQKFDGTIYKGHETGRIQKNVEPVRAKPEFQSGKTPGKAAPSGRDVLKRKLGK